MPARRWPHLLLAWAYPAMYVVLGALGMMAAQHHRHPATQPLVAVLVILLGLLYATESVATHPDYTSYFSPTAGG